MASVSLVRFVPPCREDSIKRGETEAEELIPSGSYVIIHSLELKGCLIAVEHRLGLRSMVLRLKLSEMIQDRVVDIACRSIFDRKNTAALQNSAPKALQSTSAIYSETELQDSKNLELDTPRTLDADKGAYEDFQRPRNPWSKKHFGSCHEMLDRDIIVALLPAQKALPNKLHAYSCDAGNARCLCEILSDAVYWIVRDWDTSAEEEDFIVICKSDCHVLAEKHFGSTESIEFCCKMTNYEEQNPSSNKYPAPSKFSGSMAKYFVAVSERPREWHTVTVDPGGSEVQVPGAKIVFPRGAVKKKEHFQFQINYQQSEEGPGRIRITPELSCRPSKEFLKNVRIELRTWCLSSPKIEIICNREDGTNDYEHVTIDNHEGHKVVFETSHFTRFRGTRKIFNARRGAFALRWILYRKFQQYHAMFLLGDWHEMLEKASGLKEDGFHIVQMANPVVIKACDVIKISLSSAAYKVRPGKAEFTLDSDLLAKRRRVLSFEVESAPEGTIQELDCKFYVNGKGQDYYPINHMVAERGPSVGKRARRMQTASMKEDSSCDDSNGEKCSQQK